MSASPYTPAASAPGPAASASHVAFGVTFGTYEHMLPSKARGSYHEYTVKTPGSRSRGARRIVCGGERERRSIIDCYYSDDHYQSFRRILP